jgi:antitoxin component YwqK of YwqJK toxin-antitoxin module
MFSFLSLALKQLYFSMLQSNIRAILVLFSLLGIFLNSCGEAIKDTPKDGEKITYYKGDKQIKTYIPYKNYLWHGFYKEYYANGNVKVETFYEQGKKSGLHRTYFEDGKLHTETYYNKEGRKDSVMRGFFASGQIEWEGYYKSDKLEGKDIRFYANGKLHRDFFYKNGKKDGEQKAYYKSDKLKYVAYFKNGEVGTGLKEYEEDGKEIKHNYKIVVTEENKLAFEDEYWITIKIQPDNVAAKVYVGDLDNEKYLSSKMSKVIRKDGMYIQKIHIPKNTSFMKSFYAIAIIETVFGNQLLLTKKVNVAENNI